MHEGYLNMLIKRTFLNTTKKNINEGLQNIILLIQEFHGIVYLITNLLNFYQ